MAADEKTCEIFYLSVSPVLLLSHCLTDTTFYGGEPRKRLDETESILGPGVWLTASAPARKMASKNGIFVTLRCRLH